MTSDGGAGTGQTRLILLGTAAGRTWSGGSARTGISSALEVGGRVYLVDCGQGWGRRYMQAGLGRPGAFHGLEYLRALFITHLHSDHMVDLGSLFTFGLTDGLPDVPEPVTIIGPGSRGSLPPAYGSRDEPLPTVNPDNPMPGTRDIARYLLNAFAADLNDNIRDSLRPSPEELVSVQDIELPIDLVVRPDDNPAQRMSPFLIFEDERVRVTATLVDHRPAFPAFAFRFDTDQGSVVFSGDTCAHPNLIELADHADLLVHEVIDPDWVESLFGPRPTEAQRAKMRHLLEAHTPVSEVGAVAESANARALVLSHLAPADCPPDRWLKGVSGFSGAVHVAEDLDEFILPPR